MVLKLNPILLKSLKDVYLIVAQLYSLLRLIMIKYLADLLGKSGKTSKKMGSHQNIKYLQKFHCSTTLQTTQLKKDFADH